jgi:hypothetical protein
MKLMQDLRATGRKAFGPDFDVTICKHADFGDDCCELLIYGKHHREAAAALGCAGSVVTILQGRRTRDGSTFEYAALRMPLKN